MTYKITNLNAIIIYIYRIEMDNKTVSEKFKISQKHSTSQKNEDYTFDVRSHESKVTNGSKLRLTQMPSVLYNSQLNYLIPDEKQ